MLRNLFIFDTKRIVRKGNFFSRPYIYLLFAVLSINATCERAVDLNIDLPEPSLVVISNFTLNEPLKVRVSKSQNILDESPEEYLANAVVSLYQDDVFLEELSLMIDLGGRTAPYYITSNFIAEHSITYTVIVEAEGFKTVTAHSFIPLSIEIDEFEVSNLHIRSGIIPSTIEYTYSVFLNFNDPADEENYYHLNFYQEVLEYSNTEGGDTIVTRREIYPTTFNNLDNSNYIEAYIGGGVLLKEKPFNEGMNFSLMITINPDFQLLGQVYAELRTVSKEYFNFHSSISRQQSQAQGPFETEIIIFNNVMNGQGVFAGYNIHTDSTSLDI